MSKNKGWGWLLTILSFTIFVNFLLVKDSNALTIKINTDKVEHTQSEESSIKNQYVANFNKLKLIVNNHYESSWWKPKKEEIITKIDKFLNEFNSKNLLSYSILDIDKVSLKLKKIRTLLSDKCELSYNALERELLLVGARAKIFLKSNIKTKTS